MAFVSSASRQTPKSDESGNTVPLRRLVFAALGTRCEVQYVCEDGLQSEKFDSAVISWVQTFEARYSRFRPDSILSRINAQAGQWVPIDSEMEGYLDMCGMIYQMSTGILDVTALPLAKLWNYKTETPRIPDDHEIESAKALVGWPRLERRPREVRLPMEGMALDFGGWGKEYAVDVVAGIARDHGIQRALVDFGHDMHAIGAAPGKPGWHIGLEDPDQPGVGTWGSLSLNNRSLASSGDYLRGFTLNGRRYGHIIDPRSGYPVNNGNRQVTVIAPSCLMAGIFATTCFILDAESATRLMNETPGVEGCILTQHARHQTRSFFNYVVSN